MPAACRSSCRGSRTAWWSIADCRRSTAKAGGRWRARPPAHSTVTFNDTSSCRFFEFGHVPAHAVRHADRRRPARRARSRARTRRRRDAARLARRLCRRFRRHPPARAAALARRPHARRRGQLHAARGRRPPASRDEFAIRFHLHPAVKANRLTDGHGAMLLLPDKRGVDLQRLRGRRSISRKASISPAPTARAAPCRS